MQKAKPFALAIAAGLLLVLRPAAAYALGDIWPSPADVLLFFGKVLLTLGVALCAGLLLSLLAKPETPPPGATAAPAEPAVAPRRLLLTGALSLPVHAGVLYLASFFLAEVGAGPLLRLYGGLGLPLLGLCALLWRARRPSASLGLGLSWVLAVALLLTPALNRGQAAAQGQNQQPAAPDQFVVVAPRADQPASIACPWTEQVYDRAAQLPRFPGGDSVLHRLIRAELRYPLQHASRGEAAVRLSYVVRPDGSVCGVQILESPGRGFDHEATRAVQQLPPFLPGRLPDGRFVAVRCTLTIAFPAPVPQP